MGECVEEDNMIDRTDGSEETLGAATRWLELIDLEEFQVAWRSASAQLTAE